MSVVLSEPKCPPCNHRCRRGRECPNLAANDADMQADASPRYADNFAPYWVGALIVLAPFLMVILAAAWACWG